ncbi:hypothetical protein HDV00_001253 [Rhizophlyctis rosea]|nr:hypothetical protein HDV00_001253 [Rhizophlyctis rosea]
MQRYISDVDAECCHNALLEAGFVGDGKMLVKLLKEGARTPSRPLDFLLHEVLLVAAWGNHTGFVRGLLEAGATDGRITMDTALFFWKKYQVTTTGSYAFEFAVRNRNHEIVDMLLKSGTYSNDVLWEGVRQATRRKAADVLKVLLPLVNVGTSTWHQFLYDGKYAGNTSIEVIEQLLSARKGGRDAEYLLQGAMTAGNLKNVRYIIDRTDDSFLQDSWNHIEFAIRYGSLEIIDYFLKTGADVSGKGDLLLLMAARRCRHDVVALLLRGGSDIKRRRDLLAEAVRFGDGPTGVRWPCRSWVLRLLIKKGADLHYGNERALRMAVGSGRADRVSVLLEEKAKVQARNDLLSLAVKRGNDIIIVNLLLAGADLHEKNEAALRMAVATGRADLVKMLFMFGAKLPVSFDLLNEGLKCGNADVVKLLVEAGCRWTMGCLITLMARCSL